MKRVHAKSARANWPSSRADYQRDRYKRFLAHLPGEVTDLLEAMALMTQEECGKKLGISRQAVHQGERRALRKIRAALAEYRRQARA